MKLLRWVVSPVVVLAIIGFIVWWHVPFSFAGAKLDSWALSAVARAQSQSGHPLSPEECALKYHYHGTDYEKEIPKRIEVSSKDLGDGIWRVRIHDPTAEDDSIFESVARIYLQKTPEGHWQPLKAEYVHKARGRFGWTTKPGT